MIRPATLISMVLAAGSGLYLYQVKHQAQLLDEEIAHILNETDHARQRTGELVAEYALLNDPSRLQDLAAAHLKLRPTEPTQFTTLAELTHRLPPVGAPAPAAPEPPADIAPPALSAAVAAADAKPKAVTPSTDLAMQGTPPAGATVVAVRPPRPRPSATSQNLAAQSIASQSSTALFGAPVQSAMLPPQRPIARSAMTPLLAAAHTVRPSAPSYSAGYPASAPAYAPSYSPSYSPAQQAPIVGSALGMARSNGSAQAGYLSR